MDALTTQVLEYCNDVRRRLDLSSLANLEPGHDGNAAHCPIANTIAYDSRYHAVVYSQLHVGTREMAQNVMCENTPACVRDWIYIFDQGLDYELYREDA